jgi:RNA polymerase subunit RPABC4/transcription elongation factor Spt4
MEAMHLCPKCRSLKHENRACPSCGHIVFRKQIQAGACTKCGYINPAGKTRCFQCGHLRSTSLVEMKGWQPLFRSLLPVLIVLVVILLMSLVFFKG